MPAVFVAAALWQMAGFIPYHANLYPIILESWTYWEGMWRRSLLSSLFALFDVPRQSIIYGDLMHAGHVAGCAVLLICLGFKAYAIARAENGPGARTWLAFFFAGGITLQGLAFSAGFIDVFMVLGLWAAHELLLRGRAWSILPIAFLFLLLHEATVPFFAGLMLAHMFLAEGLERKRAIAFGVYIAGTVAFLVASNMARANFNELLAGCQNFFSDMAPDDYKWMWGVCYCYLRQSFWDVFSPMRLLLTPITLVQTGFFFFAGLAAMIYCWKKPVLAKERVRLPVAALFALSGIGMLLVAVDRMRFCYLALFVLWLVLDRWMEMRKEKWRAGPKLTWVLLFFAALPFTFDYAFVPRGEDDKLLLEGAFQHRPVWYGDELIGLMDKTGFSDFYNQYYVWCRR